jgi:hypothetical protein
VDTVSKRRKTHVPAGTLPRVFSFGGGVQSTAALVLSAHGTLAYDTFLFANTGDDSENPDTLAYVRGIALPYAEANGLHLAELHRVLNHGPRRGQIETLYRQLTRPGSKSIPIPMRLAKGAPGRRLCTETFKLDVIRYWIDDHTSASSATPVEVGVGITTDEIGRMRTDQPVANQRRTYPLIDLRLTREDCARVIASAGLPLPPKSACYFCPFHRVGEWAWQAEHRPDLFEKAARLETLLNRRRAELGRDTVYLHSRRLPLRDAVRVGGSTAVEDGCDSGHCMT